MMNAQAKVRAETAGDVLHGIDTTRAALAGLREPFTGDQVSKLPKPTKKQTEEVKADFKKGIRCKECDSWHHPDVIHLDYVGHAALTDRLLDVDPEWSWEPMGRTPEGLPMIAGGLWIKLTVCGVSRYGFGAADGKSGGDAVKEMIGDALRNAAMRFGAALNLWHKGDLHANDDAEEQPKPRTEERPEPKGVTEGQKFDITALAREAGVSIQTICEAANVSDLADLSEEKAGSIVKKLRLTIEKMKPKPEPATTDVLDDEIPY
jgi:hypothetical protein